MVQAGAHWPTATVISNQAVCAATGSSWRALAHSYCHKQPVSLCSHGGGHFTASFGHPFQRLLGSCVAQMISHDATQVIYDTTHVTYNATHVIYDTTHVTHNATHVIYDTTHVTHNATHVIYDTTHVTHNATHVIYVTTHVTPNATHVIHVTTHVTHNAAHVMHDTTHVTWVPCNLLSFIC